MHARWDVRHPWSNELDLESQRVDSILRAKLPLPFDLVQIDGDHLRSLSMALSRCARELDRQMAENVNLANQLLNPIPLAVLNDGRQVIMKEPELSEATQLADDVLKLSERCDQLARDINRNFWIGVCGAVLAITAAVSVLIINAWSF